MINFDYTRATSTKGALDAMSRQSNAQFIAGGTNLVDLMKRGVAMPERLIDITKLPLKGIEVSNNVLRVGSLTPNSDMAAHELVNTHFPLLAGALRAGASPQLRNMATAGGNLLQRTRCPYFYNIDLPCNKRSPGSGCSALNGYNRMHAVFGTSPECIAVHPSDMAVALTALNAVVVAANSKGERRIPMTDFHRLPGNTPEKDNNLAKGELITSIEIPLQPQFSAHAHYTKIRDRQSYAFALVSVAAALALDGNTIKDARLAMGGVAHKPWRLTAAESFLKGKAATKANFEQAAQLAFRDAKGYGQNNFKLKLGPNTLVSTLLSLNQNG